MKNDLWDLIVNFSPINFNILFAEVKLQNAETTESVDVETETTDVNSIEVNHDDSTKSQASPEKVVNNVKVCESHCNFVH